ncbi:MAG: ImmA/IrrE family metallo-endopeptidase [Chloroflexi bacterium]|nr:ImmA/IrrE family metallo-endopeptidase [Chloroflexota bacterium]
MTYRVKPVVEFMADDEIEDRANKLLRKYEAQHGPIHDPPVPVEFIAEDTLGFEVKLTELDDANTVAYIAPDQRQICVNELQSEYLNNVGQEFTIAHEIGHWVLDHFAEDRTKTLAGLDNQPTRFLHRGKPDGQYKRHEIQAEHFASCLLMPKKLILPLVTEFDVFQWRNLYDLQAQFHVSITAMTKRLQKLKLIYIRGKCIYANELEAHGTKRLF